MRDLNEIFFRITSKKILLDNLKKNPQMKNSLNHVMRIN